MKQNGFIDVFTMVQLTSRDQLVHIRTQQRESAEKSGIRDVKRADFIRYWRRSGLKNPDKPKIFI